MPVGPSIITVVIIIGVLVTLLFSGVFKSKKDKNDDEDDSSKLL